MLGLDFLNLDFSILNLPKIVDAIYGSICKIFHAKFPSISNGRISRSITQSTLNESIPSKASWNEKKINFSRKFFESTNKQTRNSLLSFVIRRAQVVAPHFSVKMSSNPIIWLIEQPSAPLSCKNFSMKNTNKIWRANWFSSVGLSW